MNDDHIVSSVRLRTEAMGHKVRYIERVTRKDGKEFLIVAVVGRLVERYAITRPTKSTWRIDIVDMFTFDTIRFVPPAMA